MYFPTITISFLTSSSGLSTSRSLAVACVAAPLVGEEVVEEGRSGQQAGATKVLGVDKVRRDGTGSKSSAQTSPLEAGFELIIVMCICQL